MRKASLKNKIISIEDKFPDIYNLVIMRYEDGYTHPGWWSGHEWDSARNIRKKPIIGWSKI